MSQFFTFFFFKNKKEDPVDKLVNFSLIIENYKKNTANFKNRRKLGKRKVLQLIIYLKPILLLPFCFCRHSDSQYDSIWLYPGISPSIA